MNSISPPGSSRHVSTFDMYAAAGHRSRKAVRLLPGRNIDNRLSELVGGAPKSGGTYLDAQGKVQECFHLPKHETMVLVTGYSVPLRDQVLRRLEQLEAMIAHATQPNAGLVTDLAADVRAAVATIKTGAGVSDQRAVEILEAMAKGNGARPEQIAKAKRCLQ